MRCRSRRCEEPLRRSNPESLCGKILDCFASLAMTGRVMQSWVHQAPISSTPPVTPNARRSYGA
ncbi:hypothetical protein EAS61_04835 [Bradyrhizobium zhanjiangense]|uniref:Uncharacterized protein n=1 Tax=Bradyrhizobium zhanjiangense TaxID=1325107 RepID=A0A4Q0QWH3_9BRAD|nr:hypothetical protein EAS61_04835 [Bradyrhizobium zhanjiangense]